MAETEKQYVVWSSEHSAWWGPERCGYFTRIGSAGRYTREEALEICRRARGGREFNDSPTEVPLPLKDAEVFLARRTARMATREGPPAARAVADRKRHRRRG